MKSTIMIAATRSNSGKTTFTTGFLNAIKNKYSDNKSVQAFKCGPDYIDPMFHKSVLSINSTNLDPFFLDEEGLRKVFYENSGDINVIEAAMGLYDGIGVSKRASAYEVAASLNIKIILLVDASGIGYSLIPLLKGFIGEDNKKLISGVVLNKISEKFYKKIALEIEKELSIKVFGYIPVINDAIIKSRHLGLISPKEADFYNKLSLITQKLAENVDIDGIINIGKMPDSDKTDIIDKGSEHTFFYAGNQLPLTGKKIIVSKDEAFSFIYEEICKIIDSIKWKSKDTTPIPEAVKGEFTFYVDRFKGLIYRYKDTKEEVVSIIAHRIVQHLVDFHLLIVLVNLQGSHKLASQFHTYTYALLGNQSAEAQTQIRTEGITADVAMDIEVIVQLHVIISQSHADQVKDFLLVSWILVGESLNLVTMAAQFGDFRIAE